MKIVDTLDQAVELQEQLPVRFIVRREGESIARPLFVLCSNDFHAAEFTAWEIVKNRGIKNAVVTFEVTLRG